MAGFLVQHRLTLWRTRRDEYTKAYAAFSTLFTSYLRQLETGETTLNILIVSEFRQHDLGRREFMQHLTGRRKREFMQKWKEYEEKYYQVKDLGVLGMCIAIAPDLTELEKAKSSPHVMNQWELDRRKELHKIVHDLLQIAKNKNMT